MTADITALSGVARCIILSAPSAGYVPTKAAGMIAKYLETSLAMLNVVSDPRVIRSCFEYWIRKKRATTENTPHFVELIPSARQLVGIEQPLTTNESTNKAQLVFTFPGGLCVKVYG